MNDFKESIETNNTLTGHIETNNTLTGSLNYFKGEKGDSIFECWLQQDGNEGKTFEDFMNEVNIDLTGYATIKYVDEQINNASLGGSDVNLDGYAKLTDIPTKVSQLENDSNFITSIPSEYITETELNKKGYLTEHQDISKLALKTELHSHTNMAVLTTITNFKINQWNNKSDFSGSYNDLTNKPTIPTVDVTKAYVDGEVSKKADKSHTHNELHSHSNKTVLDGITSSKVNEWNNKSTFNGDYNSLTNKPVIPSIEGLATESYVQAKIAEASLSGGEVDLSGYATEEYVNIKVAENTDKITVLNAKLDGLELGGNITVRDVLDSEIFVIEDNDVVIPPTVTYGNIVLSTTSLSFNEDAVTMFTVKLDAAPTNDQIVNLSVNNAYCTLNKTSLTFTSNNYSTAQNITVSGVHDSTNYSDKTSYIMISSANVSSKSVSVTMKNIDTPPTTTIPVTGVSLSQSTHSMKIDETIQLTANVTPSDATNKAVTWSVSNSNATVIDGLVTAKNTGECVVTCQTVDGNKTATCTIKIESDSVEYPSNEPMVFLNGQGGIERYDAENCLIWKDAKGISDYTFVTNSSSLTNDRLKSYLWNSEQYINLSSGVTSLGESIQKNKNANFKSKEFTWEIKTPITTKAQTVLLGNGTNGINANGGIAITAQNGNLIVRASYDKIAIVNPLSTLLTTNDVYRITLSCNNEVCKLFVDGELVGQSAVSTYSINDGVFALSTMNYRYVKYWNRCLTEEEITRGGE